MNTTTKSRVAAKHADQVHSAQVFITPAIPLRIYNPADAWCRGCKGTDMSRVGEKNGFYLLTCDNCGTTVVNPYPSDAELVAYYSGYRMTSSYATRSASKLRRGLSRVKRMLRQKPPGTKFLDIGCSLGFVVKAAEISGLEAHGIDIDSAAIASAQQQFGSRCHFESISIQELARREGAVFDMVYLSEAIEHVRDTEDFVAHLSAVMRPGAIAYITCPDGGHYRTPKKIAEWNMVCPPEHLTFFTREGIKRLLARHGLQTFRFQWAFKPGIKLFARKVS